METKPTKDKTCWINEETLVKKFVQMAKQYYGDTLSFVRNGSKSYTAKLDPSKLKIDGVKGCSEAYFDITTCGKGKKNDAFFLRLVDGKNVNTIKLL